MLTTSVVWLTIIVSAIIQQLVHAAVDLKKCNGILMPSEPVYLYNNHCYLYDTDRMVWDDAQKACESRGGNLAAIPDASTQQFLIKTALDMRWHTKDVWIGATDKQTEGHWKWSNGQDVTYNNWANGSPKLSRTKRFLFGDSDAAPDYYAGISDCVFMSLPRGGIWRDVPCHENKLRFAFICEFELRKPPAPATTTTTMTTTTILPSTTSSTASTSSQPTTSPITTVVMSTEDSVAMTTTEDEVNTTMLVINEGITEEFTNFSIIVNNSQPIDDIEHIDPDKTKLTKSQRSDMIAGLSVGISLIAIVGLAAVTIVYRVRSKQHVQLDDVVAFENSAYTAPKTDELQIDANYFLDKPSVDSTIPDDNNHIYQTPEDAEEKSEDNSTNIHV